MFILSGVVHFDEEATWDGSFDAVLTWYNSAELIIVHISLTTLCCMQQILSLPPPLPHPTLWMQPTKSKTNFEERSYNQ